MDGGFDAQSDSEIYFTGSMESDMGLKFGVRVQLEANNTGDNATQIDESSAWVSGAFGRIDIGARDPIHTRMHYAAAFGAGAGLNAGDTQKWIPGSYLETAGWTITGDDLTLTYVTPRTNGVQVGVSYVADSTSETSTTSAPENNDDAAWAAAINYNETVGDMSVKVSLGHINVSNPGMAMFDLDTDNNVTDARHTAKMKSDDDIMMGFDDKTFTNAGLSVGMGAFTFAASYATRDDGGYDVNCYATGAIDEEAATDGSETVAPTKLVAAAVDGDMIPCNHPNAIFEGERGMTSGVDNADPVTDAANAMYKFVEDESGQHDTWAIGISYTDGPMSVSVGHMVREQEDGDERTATEVSAGYKLAPGVAWKSSIFAVEDTKEGSEGTAFVTGLDIDF